MSCFNFIIMKVNGTDVSNLAYEEAIQLFLNAQEPIIVEVRKRGYDDSNKLNCFNYDTHMSPTLAVIASSNTPNLYEGIEYCKSTTETLSTLKSVKNPSECKIDTSSISCQTELSAFDDESKEIVFMRGDSDLNSGTFFRRKDYQASVNVDTLDGCLRAEYDMEEITLRKSQSTENLGFTISYSTEEYSDSDSCSDDCLEECKDNAGIRENRDFTLSNFSTHKYKVYVSDIVPNSLAERDGRLRQGDRILQINGQNILAKVDPNKLLAEYKHSVTILVSRNVYAADDDFLDSAVYCDDKECQDDQHQSSICECEQTTYSSKSSISRSEQKSCTSTTMTNIYPVLPIAVENVSDLFNHANIKAQLESVNKEISLLNSQISIMKLQQLQSDTQLQSKTAPSPFKTKDRNLHVSASTEGNTAEKLHSTKSQVSRPEIEIEHIYETIPEDNESEAYYCSPYEGVNDIRVEQWLKSIGCSKGKTRNSVYVGEKKKNSATGQHSVQKQQKNNVNLDDYDNSSSAYNTGGSCSSALLVLEQSNMLPIAQPSDQLNSKKQPLRCKSVFNPQSKTQYADKKISDNTASAGNSNRIPYRGSNISYSERVQPLPCSHRGTPVLSMCVPPAIPHTPDIDSDGHSTLIARSGSYKMCQYKVVPESKDEELSEVVWKVKRRPDGSRYIVRRVTKKCTQVDNSQDEESAASNEYRRQLHKFRERRQRSRNQPTPSNEKHHAQHWLV